MRGHGAKDIGQQDLLRARKASNSNTVDRWADVFAAFA